MSNFKDVVLGSVVKKTQSHLFEIAAYLAVTSVVFSSKLQLGSFWKMSQYLAAAIVT
jgi:hypothetical protein